jgi:zinc transport system permease protein
MAYFGDTLSHGALLGVALAIWCHVHLLLAVAVFSLVLAMLLKQLLDRTQVPSDALLGLLSHTALALGLIAVTALPGPRVDLSALLMGDILSVSWQEVFIVSIAGSIVLAVFAIIYRPLLAACIDRDMAVVEGHPVFWSETLFLCLLALTVALALKIIGALLITALLIIPAATARQWSRSPEQMILGAALVGLLGVSTGLWGSAVIDIATGPLIVCCCSTLFLISVMLSNLVNFTTVRRKP